MQTYSVSSMHLCFPIALPLGDAHGSVGIVQPEPRALPASASAALREPIPSCVRKDPHPILASAYVEPHASQGLTGYKRLSHTCFKDF